MARGLPKASICQMTMNGTLLSQCLFAVLCLPPTNSNFQGKYTNSNLLFGATQHGSGFLLKQAFAIGG